MKEYCPGENVWYYTDGWRIGKYIRTVERGRLFGLLEIQNNIPGYEDQLFVEAENVRAIEVTGAVT